MRISGKTALARSRVVADMMNCYQYSYGLKFAAALGCRFLVASSFLPKVGDAAGR